MKGRAIVEWHSPKVNAAISQIILDRGRSMFWNDQRVGSLRKLWSDGLPASKIAEELGGGETIGIIGDDDRFNFSSEVKTVSSTALVPTEIETFKPATDAAPSTLRFQRNAREGNPLAVYLTIYTLERLIRDLLPFYGLNCPVALVVGSGGPEDKIIRGTFATIEGWAAKAPIQRSMLVLVG